MHPRISEASWAAMYALNHGAPRLLARIAIATGHHPVTLRKRAMTEGWFTPNFLKAERCWRKGDTAGAQVEAAIAVINATPDASLVELRDRMSLRVFEELGGPAGDMPSVAAGAGEVGAGGPGASGMGGDAQTEAELAELPPDELMARGANFLQRQAAATLVVAQSRGGLLTKADLDQLSSAVSLAEKFRAMAAERAAEKQKRSDAEIAGILKRVNDRIVELARGYAEWLGGKTPER